jgi:hypothetical protein
MGRAVVLTADIVGSQHITDLPRRRDAVLKPLSRRHLEDGRVLSRYTVTAWDEFQNVLSRPQELADVVWDLRLAFRPHIELKIGVGIGSIDTLPGPDTPLNEESGGEAFLRARQASDHLVQSRGKYPLRTAIRSGDTDLDRTLNLIYLLMDSLLSNLSDRQWETIAAYVETGLQDKAAERLKVGTSTVSRNLQRGFFWQLEDARLEIRRLLEEESPPPVQIG